MAQTANAYKSTLGQELYPPSLPRQNPNLRELEGRRSRTAGAAQPKSNIKTFCAILIVGFLLVIAINLFPRVFFASSNSSINNASNQTRSSISETRAVGYNLESQYAAVTNPQNIQSKAAGDLNMVPDPAPQGLNINGAVN
jgi:hypothetical protein